MAKKRVLKDVKEVAPASGKLPAQLKNDQRRYLRLRVDSVFDPKLNILNQILRFNGHDNRRMDHEQAMRVANLQELLNAAANGSAGSKKWPVNVQEIGPFSNAYTIMSLTAAQQREIKDRFPPTDKSLTQDAILLAQQDRKRILDKILLFSDPTAIADLDACESKDYLAIARQKRQEKMLPAKAES